MRPFSRALGYVTSRRGLALILAGIAVYGAGILVLLRPLPWRAASHSPDLCDHLLTTWILSWDLHALATDPLHLFDANIFHPARSTLALSEHMLGNLPLFAPVALASGNPLLANNLLLLSSFLLSGLATAWLVHGYTGRVGPSLLAGFLFAFAPSRLSHLTHVQLLCFQYLPLALLFADAHLREGGRSAWLGFTLFTLLQFLVSYYLAYLAAAILAVYLPVRCAFLWRTLPRLRPLALAASLAVVAAAMLPVSLPYLRESRRGNIADQADGYATVHQQGADALRGYLTTPRAERGVYAGLLASGSDDVDGLFPGLLGPLLIGVWALGTKRASVGCKRGIVAAWIAVLALCYVLSLGPWLTWDGWSTGIALPVRYLASAIPGLGAVRAWSRFGIGVSLALAVLAGIGLARITAGAGRRVRAIAALAAILIAAIEFHGAPIDTFEAPARPTPAWEWLALHGEAAPVVALPADLPACWATVPMYQSIGAWLPLANGYQGHLPLRSAWVRTWAAALQLPSRDGIAQARSAGLRWVLLAGDYASPKLRAEFVAAERSGRLTLAARFGADSVYDLGGSATVR